MTAMRGYIPPTADQRALGVHSLDHFVLAVPDLKPAQRFYSDFGLDVRDDGNALALKTFGHDQSWGRVVEGARKRLHHLSFGCYADDFAYLHERAEANGVELLDPPEGFESNGFWMRDPAGVLVEVKVAPKTSPDHKTSGPGRPRRKAWRARRCGPRRLRCGRAGCRMYWCSRPMSDGPWISTRAISDCGYRTIRAWWRSCTAFMAATTTSWRSPSLAPPVCIIAVGIPGASTTSASVR